MADYAAGISGGAYLSCPSIADYMFETADFSFGAWVQMTSPGTIASMMGDGSTASTTSGWQVYIDPNWDALVFTTGTSRTSIASLTTVGTPLSDGCWHHVAAVRSGAGLVLYVDGQLQEATLSYTGTDPPPMSVDAYPLTLGSGGGAWWSVGTMMAGAIEEVTLWSSALSQAQVVQLLTCSVDAHAPSLIGYWTLDNDLSDSSASANDAAAVGTVPFVQTVDADVCYGANQYCYAQFSSSGGGTSAQVTRAQLFSVAEGTPALLVALITDYDDFTAPAGVTLSMVDPLGNSYGTATNTDALFIQLTDGVPTLIAAVIPAPGMWTVTTTGPGDTAFVLAFQTVPTSSIASTIQATLQPVYGSVRSTVGPEVLGLRLAAWVTAAAAVVAAAIVVASAPITVPMAVVVAVGAATLSAAATVIAFVEDEAESSDGEMVSVSANAMQLDSSATTIILGDGAYDAVTLDLMYARFQLTYLYALTLPFERTLIQESSFTSPNVLAALQSGGVGFMSAGSHGRPTYLNGYVADPTTAPADEILKSTTYPVAAVKGIIFHFCACHTGVACGPTMVAAGASAFFGYTKAFQFLRSKPVEGVYPDSIVDRELLLGRTAGEAHDAALAMYNAEIARLSPDSAGVLRWNRDCFVGPNTDPKYGSKDAVIGGT